MHQSAGTGSHQDYYPLSDIFLNEVAGFTSPAFSIGRMGLGCLEANMGNREKVSEGVLGEAQYLVGLRKKYIFPSPSSQ